MSYISVVKRLFSVTNSLGIKLGLANCIQLNKYIGSPCNKFKSVHVAGTNGKGSVTVKIAAGLQAAGYRVGRYTSPHISTFRERITINGEMISEEDVIKILTMLFSMAEQKGTHPTFFELTTLLAFEYFAKQEVDYAVIETGLGGRLDATNIITPQLSIITSISADHTDILGPSLEDITKEKAGIIKRQVPILIGPTVPIPIISSIAQELDSPLTIMADTYLTTEAENSAIAKKALQILQIPKEAIEFGVKAHLPCRYEKIVSEGLNHPKAIILDVAHNPSAIQALVERVHRDYPDQALHFVCGFSKNKDVQGCLKILSGWGKSFYFVAAQNERACPVRDMEAYFLNHSTGQKIYSDLPVSQAVQRAIEDASQTTGVVVICGTFYIMREARAALGIPEPTDPIELRD